MAIKIDDNVPLPTDAGCERGRGKGEVRIALEGMKVGQSFFAEADRRRCGSIRRTACIVAAKSGREFMTSKVNENGQDGLRVWRKS